MTCWPGSSQRSRRSSSGSGCGERMYACCPATPRSTGQAGQPSVADRAARGGGTDMGEGITQALALRPRPSIVVVLTDGFTPWPAEAPRGAKVIVGLIEGRRGIGPWMHGVPAPPSWAKVVRISEVDGHEPGWHSQDDRDTHELKPGAVRASPLPTCDTAPVDQPSVYGAQPFFPSLPVVHYRLMRMMRDQVRAGVSSRAVVRQVCKHGENARRLLPRR